MYPHLYLFNMQVEAWRDIPNYCDRRIVASVPCPLSAYKKAGQRPDIKRPVPDFPFNG